MTNQRIFVTNDDQNYVEMIQQLLKDAGYTDVMWHVGAAAFIRISEAQPNLVLLDINLINPARGWIALDMLSIYPKTRHIPVILFSTDMNLINQKADLLHELGHDTLEKPFTIETLLDKVASIIGPPPSTL